MIRYIFLLLWLLPLSVPAQDIDRQLMDAWYLHRNQSADATMYGITQSAYPIALALPLAQWIHGLAAHNPGSIRNGMQTAGALVAATGITYGLKYTLQRRRPYMDHPQYQPYHYDSSPSFPSGHTALAFASATSLSLCYPKWYVIAPAYAWAGAVGYSRIHLGAHYPSDVLAGAITGTLSALASYHLNRWLQQKWKQKTVHHVPVSH